MASSYANPTFSPAPLYGGEVYGRIIQKLFLQHKLFQEGKLYVQGGFDYKFSIPLSDPTYAVQDSVPTPTSSGALNFKDRVLVLSDYNLYQEFNPRAFESYWRPFQPTGNLVFEQLAPEVQAAMLSEIFQFLGQYHGYNDLLGNKSSVSGIPTGAPNNKYDGFLTKLVQASGDYAGATVLSTSPFDNGGTSGNPTGVYNAFLAAKQAAIYSGNQQLNIAYQNPDWTWVVSIQTASLWGDYQKTVQVFKGEDVTSAGVMKFDGKPIVVQPGMPENAIFGTYMSANTSSNVWVGVKDTSDETTIKVDRLQANSELYFAKMIMKRDTAIVRPEHCVYVHA